MRLGYLEQWTAVPGTVLEWTVLADSELVDSPVPPTGNQLMHLAAARTAWLAVMFDVPGPIDRRALEIAFAVWTTRHDALRCGFVRADGPGPVSMRVGAGIRLEARPDVPVGTADELRTVLGARFDEACDPFRFAPYTLAAISRPGGSTVVCAFDHAVCDAWSMTVAATELDQLYRAARAGGRPGARTAAARLPAAGSFLAYCAAESATQISRDDPRLRRWRDFLGEAGNDVPHFPDDLGLAPGTTAPMAGDVRTILDAADADSLELRCHDDEYSVFAALLAVVGQAVAGQSGRARTLLLAPVHTRREPLLHNVFGWLVGNAPIVVDTDAVDFTASARAADDSIRAGRVLAEVPPARLLGAMGSDLRLNRADLFTVSFVDYRRLPGGSRYPGSASAPRNCVQLSRGGQADDVQMWFSRTDDGLSLRTRFPRTALAQARIREFLDRLTAGVQAVRRADVRRSGLSYNGSGRSIGVAVGPYVSNPRRIER
ncbi:condensation domain-containing protein [Nocardia sp. CA-128927]|uniref:condensation domain-containing protein n=1 Tax=Nocardia sp. CA-128927 TaxID=3239975 RepID=UPI003D9750E3